MIRPYQDSDKGKLMELCREFWEASCADDLGEFDELHTSSNIDAILSRGVCFVTDNVDGFIMLSESCNLCNPRPIAAEVAWYVSPASRGGSGLKLLKAAFSYCELKNIKCLSMMYMQTSMPESIRDIYVKLGLELRETTYIKRF